ncbi:cyclic pyranopterin phosphate synthase [Leucobacter sp. OLJS4]|uniref:GTP 3',8-cyclase MoaA n=1 Tax=unclassified Leucobacter TaxID=2621730 RepID=UPI000C1A753A|nr:MULTISPECIES: GTP 3',8-cyclase MoaA [unclassified Leucobacter]PII85296.1 cyclic pyranopterin phosphate synthase [Leucobacter sp. OLCALW19]PII93076.1 cyclic pyranopterin phosphate synthase [Leucobacter sp. OLAS13]PII95948.1 cyclic pyranopterin phosphate synthase [Leucobacter sp. OLTLW20]PII99252.1 cyclic pyranopterin phosphate synthase [Leucobacter sp. OLDS2]PIJ01253.1 cyclic pyranopterin phosphate synthase [Leucobacter sp. OLIS6]
MTSNAEADGASARAFAPRALRLPSTGLPDTRGRALRDLRISVTDRCNFRCVYCMPKEIFGADYRFMERDELLSFDEIVRVASAAVDLGVDKLRLTGGEPLLRRGIEALIGRLSELRTPDGRKPDLAMTTNGSALRVKAEALKAAGLDRVTVSVDSLDDGRFQAINDVRFPVQRVLDGMAAAAEAGLGPVKVNAVIKRGVNDDEIVPLAEHFRASGHTLRFIEYMDVGSSNGWVLDDVVPSAEIVRRIDAAHPLEAVDASREGETAKRWRYRDGSGEIGVISSVTGAFCGSCTRARVSADGKLFTCLFASQGTDLRALLRGSDEQGRGCDDAELRDALAGVWARRDDRYSELRAALPPEVSHDRERIEMSYIGG